MPKDKRLLIIRAIVQQIGRRCASDAKREAESVGLHLSFVVPFRLLEQEKGVLDTNVAVPFPAYATNGKSSALIVHRSIAIDCAKINKRYALFDAVIPVDSLDERLGEDAQRKARALLSFRRVVVDAAAEAALPACLKAVRSSSSPSTNGDKSEFIVSEGLHEGEDLTARLIEVGKGIRISSCGNGICKACIGHAGMTAGDIAENAKAVVAWIKRNHPHVYSRILEFKLCSSLTEPIRLLEAHISK